MSEVVDTLAPILREIQADVAVLKRDSDGLNREVAIVQEKLDGLQTTMTYHMGFTLQHQIDIAEMKTRLKALEAKL